MTQITQRQINEAMQQAHIERAKAFRVGLDYIRKWIGTHVAEVGERISKTLRTASSAQN
jgi:hypothetical protein